MSNTDQDAARLDASAMGVSLTVNDLPKSVAWYREVLGFQVAREYAPRGTLIAVALRAGTVELLLTQDNGAQGIDRVKGLGFSLQFIIGQNAADVDAVANGIAQRGGVFDDPPADAFGARVFRLRDPDGFKLVFSSQRAS